MHQQPAPLLPPKLPLRSLGFCERSQAVASRDRWAQVAVSRPLPWTCSSARPVLRTWSSPLQSSAKQHPRNAEPGVLSSTRTGGKGLLRYLAATCGFECRWVCVQMPKAQSWASETQKERPPECESKAPLGSKFYTIHIKKEGGGREEREGRGRMWRNRNSGLSSGISWKMGLKGWTVDFEISSTYFSTQE